MKTKRAQNCIIVRSLEKSFFYHYETDNCPICHTYISPENLINVICSPNRAVTINRCPKCSEIFVVAHSIVPKESSFSSISHVFIAPQKFTPKSFDPCIYDISERFTEIYNQALQAESLALDEISGMGFRKALEILVKDYIKFTQPGESENIEVKSLSKCIEDNIDNFKIKELAKKAAWLGNDEAHYVSFFADYDVPSIKSLIDAIVYFIEFEYVLAKAEAIPHKSTLK